MNFLGHAWLTPPHAEILVGNFTADFVGAKPPNHWTEACIEGWRLHRAIDTFTDGHPGFKILKSELFPLVGHYASVLVDLWLDHILSAEWTNLNQSGPQLDAFCAHTYSALHSMQSFFPNRFSAIFERMRQENWLKGYAQPLGLVATLQGLSFRSPGFQTYLQHFQGPDPLVELLTHPQHPMRKEGIRLLLDAKSTFTQPHSEPNLAEKNSMEAHPLTT